MDYDRLLRDLKSILGDPQKKKWNLPRYRRRSRPVRSRPERSEYENNPNYYFYDLGGGAWRAFYKRGEEGKKITKAIKAQADEVARLADWKEIIIDELIDFKVITRIQIREKLDDFAKFSVENLKMMVETFQDMGKTVK